MESENTIEISLARFEELIKTESKVETLLNYIDNEKFCDKETICIILGKGKTNG